MTDDLRELQSVLVITAHPDDAEFGAGGTIVRFVRAGAAVHVCVVTNGASGSKDPDLTREKLVEIRKAEQAAANKVLGITELIWLDYEDAYLEPTIDLRKDLARVIRRIGPDLVITHDPSRWYIGDRYINHPDHRATGEAAFAAIMPSSDSRLVFPELETEEGLPTRKPRAVWLTYPPEPDHWVDITETLDTKIEALKCHVSQIGAEWDGASVRDAAKATGEPHGLAAAEAFKAIWY